MIYSWYSCLQAEREHWGEVLLGWMSEQPLDESLQHHELLKALAGALAGGRKEEVL